MNFILKINSEPLEIYFCKKHEKWNNIDNEMNCCAMEIEELLQEHSEYLL